MELEQTDMNPEIATLHAAVEKVKEEIGKVIVGQEAMIELLLAAIVADGHVLIEGVPGVLKHLLQNYWHAV